MFDLIACGELAGLVAGVRCCIEFLAAPVRLWSRRPTQEPRIVYLVDR